MANLQNIKNIAERKGMTIRELADRVGLKENQIHVMCRTNSTKIDTLEKIAKELGVSISCFFDEVGEVQIREAGRDYVEKGKIEHNGTDYSGSSTEADLRDQIAQLKSQLADKERIIKLMEGCK